MFYYTFPRLSQKFFCNQPGLFEILGDHKCGAIKLAFQLNELVTLTSTTWRHICVNLLIYCRYSKATTNS